jgi:hypothetical protein
MITSFNITAKNAAKYSACRVIINVKMIPSGLTEGELVGSRRDMENRLFKLLAEEADVRDIAILKKVTKLK